MDGFGLQFGFGVVDTKYTYLCMCLEVDNVFENPSTHIHLFFLSIRCVYERREQERDTRYKRDKYMQLRYTY